MCLTIRSYMNYIECVLTCVVVFVCSACGLQKQYPMGGCQVMECFRFLRWVKTCFLVLQPCFGFSRKFICIVIGCSVVARFGKSRHVPSTRPLFVDCRSPSSLSMHPLLSRLKNIVLWKSDAFSSVPCWLHCITTFQVSNLALLQLTDISRFTLILYVDTQV